MLDFDLMQEVLENGKYHEVCDALCREFDRNPECESYDTLLWIKNVLGHSPAVLTSLASRPATLMTGDTFFEIGIALTKCFQTGLLHKLGSQWVARNPDDYRPHTLLALAEFQRGNKVAAQEWARKSARLNSDQSSLEPLLSTDASYASLAKLDWNAIEKNLVWLPRLARELASSRDWQGLQDVSEQILSLAPEHPMGTHMKARAIRERQGEQAAWHYSKSRFDVCYWYEPFFAHHCLLDRKLLKLGDLIKSIRAYAKSRDQARKLGEGLVSRFKPVAFVQSVAGWHDF